MAKNTCKLCSRRFASPRALAGHMRSHSQARAQAEAAAAAEAEAAAAAAAAAKQQISSASSASASFFDTDEDVSLKTPASTYGLRENPKRSLRVADASFSDRESEAESIPPPAMRVNAAAIWGEPEPAVSSLSEASPPEHVALSLMMLSRDSWPSAVLSEDEDDDDPDDGSDDGYPTPAPRVPRAPAPVPAPVQKRRQFQCVACKKVFGSYQALGGHRASNVRGGRGGCCAPPVARAPPQPRSHVCGGAAAASLPGTGTAAGTASTTSAAAPPSPINSSCMIDLNVAPPSEEVELSAVSDPRFNPGA